jgi:ArsR family transcriptional regulator
LPTLTASPVVCCAPIVREPLSESDAAELAVLLKAVADPVRLRLLSMIGSHAGGEACVCDLTDAFELTAPTIFVPEVVARLGELFS